MDDAEKEKRRRKQHKRMEKILARAWALGDEFQQAKGDDGLILCLTSIGQKLDNNQYKLGKHGWHDFARDLGGVYNRHIIRKTKKATAAKQHLEAVKELLAAKDESLSLLASKYAPVDAEDVATGDKKKRPSDDSAGAAIKKKQKSNKNKELAEREERAVEQLALFIEEHGGSRGLVHEYRARVTKKMNGKKFDVNFYDRDGRRYRSMLEVGRHFGLVKASDKTHYRRTTTRENEAEKKKLRKELERLRKAHQRATKALDDFNMDEKESRYPIDDRLLMEEEQEVVSRANCAASLKKDIEDLAGVPEHCIPDVIMTWDFLCTFQRALSLSPIELDDFASALSYMPPDGQIGDDIVSAPVYIGEAHMSLIKILLQDGYSDDWWWSTLESPDEAEGADEDAIEQDLQGKPVIKFDMQVLLSATEDNVVTTSWLKALEGVGQTIVKTDEVKGAIKTAISVVGNKWVYAYLRKALDGLKSNPNFTKQAIIYLVDRVKEARPDLRDRSLREETLRKAREHVVKEVSEQMATLSDSVPAVTEEDALSDVEYEDDSDEESDIEDRIDDARRSGTTPAQDEAELPSSPIPLRPPPTLVDLLLPPTRPHHSSEYINAFTWPHVAGAMARRILHRKKRLLNEIDDYLRSARELPPINVTERREREKQIASRVLMECAYDSEGGSPTEEMIEHLCSGGNYLQLSTVQRLALLRLFIESVYDTVRAHEVVSENIKQRTGAMKALEVEQRRAKREIKEKATVDEAAARERLALEAKETFLDEKREEIRRLNEKSKDLDDEIIESLTEEDIIDFDEDIKADFDALPGPDSFNKSDVKDMVARMQEEAAFETDALHVLTMDELFERERRQLEELQGQLQGFGGENALLDPSLDRETVRSIERLQRDIDKAKELAEKLPALRERALEQLKDAIRDGTIKVLRSALTAARKARLSGPDDETGGVWAVNLMRDAALELENAKQNKRVIDAQRDLVAKRNKCFIRNDPIGRDRFGNRFWSFDNDEDCHVWVETEFLVSDDPSAEIKPIDGHLNLFRQPDFIAFGAPDKEGDFMGEVERQDQAKFLDFSRREYHSTGFTPTLCKSHWGCLASEDTVRGVIKALDSRGVRECELKIALKESLEHTVGNDEKTDGAEGILTADTEVGGESIEMETSDLKTTGDEEHFLAAKDAAAILAREGTIASDDLKIESLHEIRSGIGQRVRVRNILDESKDPPLCRYESGVVTGWKTRREVLPINGSSDDGQENHNNTEIQQNVLAPVWEVLTDRCHRFFLNGTELVLSMYRCYKRTMSTSYFEDDAAFLAYRNNLGRFLGRAQDAPYACSPNNFARLMVKKEGDLYAKLKIRSYDNSWGGKSGARALWTNSMKDYAFDFQTVQQGLLTLENAFFELTGQFTDYKGILDDNPDAVALLANPATRNDVELETIEKNVPGLWNSPSSRAVFREIVSRCKTTGFLALALDLLCRNTTKYLQTHKLLNSRTEPSEFAAAFYNSFDDATGTRRTRRMNAWQQKERVNYEEFF